MKTFTKNSSFSINRGIICTGSTPDSTGINSYWKVWINHGHSYLSSSQAYLKSYHCTSAKSRISLDDEI